MLADNRKLQPRIGTRSVLCK